MHESEIKFVLLQSNNINIGLLIVAFLVGLIIGFVINDIIKRIA